MQRWLIVLIFASVSVGFAACSSGGSKPPCGMTDAAVYEAGISFPAGCPPAQPNELGIGKPCAMCGNECTNGLRCTCDPYLGAQLSGVPCVCTKLQLASQGSTDPCHDPALPANFCGTNATCCNYITSAAYCVPDVCLPGGQCIVFVPITDGGTQ
jgi:hypothetical protein